MKKILGMGNALVDIMIPVENDNILELLSLPKGSMQLVDIERSNTVLSALKDYQKSHSAGGSAANTIHALAMLGAQAGYIGVVGEDELGGFFVRDLIQAGVDPHLIHSQQETGRAVALVTPDSERTFATFLGAAIELAAEHLESSISDDELQNADSKGQNAKLNLFSGYAYFHIEGYLVQNHALILRAVEMAKEHGLIVSIDMASYNVVEANRDFLLSVITKYVDIVFANEDEARALTGLEPESALHELSKRTKIAVVKTGSSGSLVKSGEEQHAIGVIKVEPIDTTGAGDLYAAGFLYGLSGGMPLQKCGELGALLAGNVIEFMGSKMPSDRWEKIRKQVKSI
ncbi:MAG: adenosine kinase [Bacteroidales bacterium]|nr:adenosine kinase [Bacteroidales bacterium]